MRVARSRAELAQLRPELTGRLGFVPTMGALHDGHLSLVEQARSRADAVAVSIFVNPLQFGPTEDFDAYPRPIEDDLARCEAAGVALVFAPTAADLVGTDPQVRVSAGALGTVLEGASRPGHFDGVLTIVLKLLHLVAPDVAVFGRKDAQQLACIEAMVADLDVPVEIVGAPIVREPDGLALSSRNAYLTPEQRADAVALSRALTAAAWETDAEGALRAGRRVLAAAEAASPWVATDYAALVDPRTFAPVGADHRGPALLALAVRVGSTRLIDNRLLELTGP
ncbi:pantoate--beta-alanine ligase [Friedmanniella endophytica]|uniref:Pantothenate synthetase n=1 Tax=Microlunatus kandeliicorticis TaxID=1759536 RepID=A0A7W3P660_9ACTN|nr:pantoate--beta-alanine ligase [Microlunatus kandeliicorticis]MBA8794638.1 pantoate--beta-alanine ligase [Microlunatus kandeliicorticis]